MRKTTHGQKLALFLFGLILGLILLEIGLRIAGFVVLSLQEGANKRSLKGGSEYVILCLGESTTAVGGDDSYPRQLENILRAQNIKNGISVINKGIVGTNTTAILSRLEDYLNTYHPDMVITMMGINEGLGTANPADIALVNTGSFLDDLRVYKLFRLLWDRVHYNIKLIITSRQLKKEVQELLTLAERSITGDELRHARKSIEDTEGETALTIESGDRYFNQDKWEEAIPFYREAIKLHRDHIGTLTKLAICLRELGRFSEDREILREILLLDPRNPEIYIELGNSFRDQKNWEAAEVFFQKALVLSPGLSRAYLEWGRSFRKQGDEKKAIEMYITAAEINQEDISAYMLLARTYHTMGDYNQAEKMYQRVLEINPEYDPAYAELGRFYDWRGRTKEAEISCKAAIAINPENELAYAELGDIYKAQKKFEKAEEMYIKALEINPLNNIAFRILALWYIRDGMFGKAEKLCKKILMVNPQRDDALGMLAICYQAQGNLDLADKYFEETDLLRTQFFNPTLARNYQKLKGLVTERGIQLVCVQYPMRKMENLKRMVTEPQGTIFVDNEDIFKKALQAGSYGDFFTDCFAGDFGHCTPKGNRLLAGNIADSILPVLSDSSLPVPEGN